MTNYPMDRHDTVAGTETAEAVNHTSRRTAFRKPVTALVLAGLTASLLGSGAVAANAAAGGGGASGTGGGTAGNVSLHYMMYDLRNPDGSPQQGRMQNSIQWFYDNSGYPPVTYHPNARDFMDTACSGALANAEARGQAAGLPAGTSRVVGMYWAGSANDPWGHGEDVRANFQAMYNDWVAQGRPDVLTDTNGYYAAIESAFNEGRDAADPNATTAICLALNDNEPGPQNYDLTVSTDKTGTFTTAGSTNAVTDTIHASNNGSSISENVDANVIMHWDGVEGNSQTATKTVSIANNGDTLSPAFTPSDFGWTAWPSGNFWFDVQVSKQGKMKAAVDTPDRDARESWSAATVNPSKELTVGTPPRVLAPTENLASGMTYDARIKANTNGYASAMTIYDTIQSDKVWIGSQTADVASAVKVLDPTGAVVPNATINIDRSVAGKVTVSGRVANIPAQFTGKEYTLVVPTYVLPTATDYTIPDGSQVCFADATMNDPSKCLVGNNEQTRKVTPAPDKVWVLDQNGGLTAADPAGTNQVSADQKVFFPGDAVSAVVNGSVHQGLASDLSNYKLIDDWTKAAQYVDFSDASKAHVYYETAPGSGQYTDVTAQFDVTVSGSVTTATAKPSFLAGTAGLTGDRKTKLVVSGDFRKDYDTNGATVQLFNDGAEVWNNQTVQTNEPPVFTWTPNPNKQVLGSADESGDLAHSDINGLAVYPGQKLEYSIGVDLRIPTGTALGVKKLAVKDVYDPKFAPDKASVEFWDSRDALNPRPVPRSAYKLTWDDATHSFTAEFTDAWIAANVNAADGAWLNKGWLTVRFTGKVLDTAPAGGTVVNQAFQIINDVSTPTEIPVVNIPAVTPDKEDLSTDLVNIDGKTVVQGDHILYRLTLDGGASRDKLAYNVHKLGMVDDFDEQYLDLATAGVKVVNQATGADVTDKFNVQIKDGVLYVFAKQVDSTDVYGQALPGDPQPSDLKAYDEANIDPLKTPIIDQSLLGSKYWIMMDTTVKQEKDGYVIKNQAVQNIENTRLVTRIVSNPLKDIDPTKDVVVSEQTKDASISTTEVKLDSTFNYRLNSSELPANRAYGAKNWSISDKFDRIHDQYTGVWAVYANTDLYDGSTKIADKGDLLADSAGHEPVALQGLFKVTFDEVSYSIKVEATQKYLDLVNSRGDLAQAFSVYTQIIRIAPNDKISNVATENYNTVDRETNLVWTSTPQHPAIDVVKYTLSEGQDKGDRDTEDKAFPVDQATINKMAADVSKNDPTAGVKVGFHITNTGDVPLQHVKVSDAVKSGTYGAVDQIVCQVPLSDAKRALLGGDAANAPKTEAVAAAQVDTYLKVGQSFDCEGTLQGLANGQLHGDTVTASGESPYVTTCPAGITDANHDGLDDVTGKPGMVDNNHDGIDDVTGAGCVPACPATITDANGDGLDDVTGLPGMVDANHDGLDDVTGKACEVGHVRVAASDPWFAKAVDAPPAAVPPVGAVAGDPLSAPGVNPWLIGGGAAALLLALALGTGLALRARRGAGEASLADSLLGSDSAK
ncbi:MAG TPA: LPXTG cell wall anchor domain-containing protein [Candidatus Lumbricidophila sp.]|nr:LPXTG cell wall anchor domain-containing protein [Candidatus Lumbricidophila sp.]